MESYFQESLASFQAVSRLREFSGNEPGQTDFSSNDYLGLTDLPEFNSVLTELLDTFKGQPHFIGTKASRLVSGDSSFLRDFESALAIHSDTETALLFAGGYMANLGLLSAICTPDVEVYYDQYCHASLKDGLALGGCVKYPYRHNDLNHLEYRLRKASHHKYKIIVAESLYSMDGDYLPLSETLELAEKYDTYLVVDEAHTYGWYGSEGRGLTYEARRNPRLLATVVTFGKALGSMGAAVLGSGSLKQFLTNVCKQTLYTTAPSHLALIGARASFELLGGAAWQRRVKALFNNVEYFELKKQMMAMYSWLPSHSPIQALIIPGNSQVMTRALQLQNQGAFVKAIRSPTVKKGTERLRISIHAQHSRTEIDNLFRELDGMDLGIFRMAGYEQ